MRAEFLDLEILSDISIINFGRLKLYNISERCFDRPNLFLGSVNQTFCICYCREMAYESFFSIFLINLFYLIKSIDSNKDGYFIDSTYSYKSECLYLALTVLFASYIKLFFRWRERYFFFCNGKEEWYHRWRSDIEQNLKEWVSIFSQTHDNIKIFGKTKLLTVYEIDNSDYIHYLEKKHAK